MIKWIDWNGKPCDADSIDQLSTDAVKRARTQTGHLGFVMSGDTVVIAQRDTDGTVTLYDCQVRRTADVKRKETP